jgi:hypothetical protein
VPALAARGAAVPGGAPLLRSRGLPGASAERVLIGASVYREPADRNALLFQVGEHDWAAARAGQQIGPAPPYRAPPGLADMVADCAAAGALSVISGGPSAGGDDMPAVFVDRWIASELHRVLASEHRQDEVTAAHLRAAQYWQWRVAAWPQSHADIHGLLEARHHLLGADETARACALTENICTQLHAWGDLDPEAELISDMLVRLPEHSDHGAALVCALGKIAHLRQDYAEAQRRYQQALPIFARSGGRQGVSRCHEGLGLLAQVRGDFAGAERFYQQAASASAGLEASGEENGAAWLMAGGADVMADLPAAPSPAPARALVPAPVLTPAPAPVLTTAPPSGRPFAAPAGGRPATPPGAPRASARTAAAHRHTVPRWHLPSLAAAAALTLMALTVAQLPGARSPAPASAPRQAVDPGETAAAVRRQAAAWIGRQVSGSAVVACDPAMCSALVAQGVAEGNLLVLNGAAADPLGSEVVAATAAVRNQFGSRLTGVYAPEAVASFGSGGARIEVLVTAPHGALAYRRALAADVTARRQAGSQLLQSKEISVTAVARRELSDGDVDSWLLITLATLAALGAERVLSFGAGATGASPGMPLRSAEIVHQPGPASSDGAGGKPASTSAGQGGASAVRTGSARYLRSVLSMLRAQRPPYLAAGLRTARLADGQAALIITFASPSPLGLLGGRTQASPSS